MIVLERVARIYAEVADVDAGKVLETTKLMEPPIERRPGILLSADDFDSLDRAEFYLGVEEEFGVELPDHRCIDFVTIGDVVAHVETLLREQGRDFTTRTGRP